MDRAKRIGIIGDGCLARHISHYFDLLSIPHSSWSRSRGDELQPFLDECEVILLMISDDALQPFVDSNPKLKDKECFHFSGATSVDGVSGQHPLMTFASSLYSRDFYQQIPFVCEAGERTLKDAIPALPNPFFPIEKGDRARYHALCVMSGNFTTLLWQLFFSEMEKMLTMEQKYLQPYLSGIANNLQNDHKSALTGPFARKDMTTIDRNMDSLKEDKFKGIYSAFVETFLQGVEH